MTTPEMINLARAWLATQTNSTPRDILMPLRDMASDLLGAPPADNAAIGENNLTTEQILAYANKWLDNAGELSPVEFLTQIRDTCNQMVLQLPRWKCSMFFKAGDNLWDNNKGVASSLNWGNIGGECNAEWRKFMYRSIIDNGGDTLLFIAEKLFNNPALQAQLMSELNTAISHGLRRLIISVKNDNGDMAWENMESYIAQLAQCASIANSDQVAFLTCLETNEVWSVEQTKQVIACLKKYAPLKRVIVGAQDLAFLRALKGTKCELWYEIKTSPFGLSQSIADQYIAELQSLLPYGPVWAGEYWDGSSELSKYITRRALEIGCAGIGSYVK